jgi:hypothetical protein
VSRSKAVSCDIQSACCYTELDRFLQLETRSESDTDSSENRIPGAMLVYRVEVWAVDQKRLVLSKKERRIHGACHQQRVQNRPALTPERNAQIDRCAES